MMPTSHCRRRRTREALPQETTMRIDRTGGRVTDERGASAVLVAASLFLLMGIAATAVDLSAGINQRRQDQTAADLGALAAVQFANGPDATTITANGTAEAIAVAEATLGIDLPASAWDTCAAPGGSFTRSQVSCVAFTSNWSRARVQIPTVEVDTSFGAVLGASSIATSAMADALYLFALEGKVLPFAVPANATNHLCLKTSPNAGSATPPCDDSDSGNFGTLDITMFGNSSLGTNKACANSFSQGRLQVNMARGVDHNLGTSNGSNYLHDKDACDVGDIDSAPNHVPGQTGVGSNLYDGMINGVTNAQLLISGFAPGRLAQGGNRVEVDSSSNDIDNTPLWDPGIFVGVDTVDNSHPCDRDIVDTNQEMLACLDAWNNDGPIFTEAIAQAIRFGAVPELPDAWKNGSNPSGYPITGIAPIYLQGTIWNCTGGGGKGGGKGGGGGGGSNCGIAHFPGDLTSTPCSGWPAIASCGVGGNAQGKLEAVTAFLLDIGMLPKSIQDSWPNTPNSGRINLIDTNQ